MKKLIIGAIVGGLIIFIWQTLSWTLLELHSKGMSHTPKQDEILQVLQEKQLEPGGYMLPMPPPGGTMEEHETFMKAYEGKPWARIYYYKEWKVDMWMNMARGLISNMIMIFFVCWIFSKITSGSFGRFFTASLLIGLIAFINQPYTGHIWYPMPDIMAFVIDAIVSWGLCGVWLGWWMNRGKS